MTDTAITAWNTRAAQQPAAHAVPDDLRGWIVLRNAIECLRAKCYFSDEEGEDTDALEELLTASRKDAEQKPAPANGGGQ